MSKLQTRWIKGERWTELQQVLALPVMQEALAIIREQAQPNSVANAKVVRGLNASDGAFRLASISNVQAGMIAALDRLEVLASPVPEKPQPVQVPEPYGYINEENFEQHLT
jgi:hypothetical protein